MSNRRARALPRQRNAYFSSSDAAFIDRYKASADWARVKAGTVPVDGRCGWRIYSSGPGLYMSCRFVTLSKIRQQWGEPVAQPVLPRAARGVTLETDIHG